MATATITIGETRYSEHLGLFASITGQCSDCDYTTWTGGSPHRDWSHLIDDHLAQHEPGRALDIDVDWEPVAECSVCGDVGLVVQVDDYLRCTRCRTEWDLSGSGGTRVEAVGA